MLPCATLCLFRKPFHMTLRLARVQLLWKPSLLFKMGLLWALKYLPHPNFLIDLSISGQMPASGGCKHTGS